MDAATLVVVFLLVTATSLASFLLSQWSSIRNSNISMGWVVTSIGITLLLAVSAIVVLTVGLLPKLGLSPSIESAEQRLESTQLGSATVERVLERQEADALTARTRAASTDVVNAATGKSIAEGHSEDRPGIEVASVLGSHRPAKSGVAPPGAGLVFTAADPWAATNCVYAFNPDPAELTRWTIENGCGAPVGVVFASCAESSPECGSQSTSWEYQSEGMVLPGRAQRPVTDEEETQYGRQIRYVACMVANPLAINLIGQSSESRSAPSWAERFDAVRNGDECLVLVHKWSNAGRASGRSIEVLLGGNVPGKVHPRATSEP